MLFENVEAEGSWTVKKQDFVPEKIIYLSKYFFLKIYNLAFLCFEIKIVSLVINQESPHKSLFLLHNLKKGFDLKTKTAWWKTKKE